MDVSHEFPELHSVRYDPQTGDIYEVDGVELGAWLPWHSDLIYVDKVNHGGILRPLVVSDRGGETGFLDKIRLYETLPEDSKQRAARCSTSLPGLLSAFTAWKAKRGMRC
jgi:taurine dioxygenase